MIRDHKYKLAVIVACAFFSLVQGPTNLSRPVRGITVNQSLGPNAGKKALINNKRPTRPKNNTIRKLEYIKQQHSACIPSVLITETNKFTLQLARQRDGVRCINSPR